MFLSPDTGARTRGDVLITGATGFLGMELMARLLKDGDRRVWALVRAPEQAAATERVRATSPRAAALLGRGQAFPHFASRLSFGVRALPKPALT